MPGLIVIPTLQNHIDHISSRQHIRGRKVDVKQELYARVFQRMLGQQEIAFVSTVSENGLRAELQELFRIGDGPDITSISLSQIDWDQDDVYFVSVEEASEGMHRWFRANIAEQGYVEHSMMNEPVSDAQPQVDAPIEPPEEKVPLQVQLLRRIAQIFW